MLKERDIFTVSFFEKEYQKALGYMGSHTGRNEDKAKAAGLTPVELPEGGLGFKEAKLALRLQKNLPTHVHKGRPGSGHPGILQRKTAGLPAE